MMPYAFEGGISQDYVEGSVEITQEEYLTALDGVQRGLHVSVVNGFSVSEPPGQAEYVPTEEELAAGLRALEVQWRDAEMLKIRENLIAIEYGADDLPGTEADWKAYWLSVRKWTEANPDFPDQAKRPVAPK